MKISAQKILKSVYAFFAVVLLLALATYSAPHARAVGEMAKIGPSTESVDAVDYAHILHVSVASGNDETGNGSSKRPWASIEKALVAVDEPTENNKVAIKVAEGTYDRSTLECRPFVDLLGGYSANSWKRDIFKFETILDGLHERRVLVGSDNCRIDGFVIRRGRAFGHGGAILCDGVSPVITNNRILDSYTVSPPDVRPGRLHQAGNRGGGIACLFDAVAKIKNNIFKDNWTEFGDGGGLSIYGWVRLEGRPRAEVENNVFIGNVSGTKDIYRTRSSSGGAIACSHEASPLIRNNVIAHNRAMGRSDAGGIYCEYFSSPEILNNWIVGNEGDDDGGGIYTMRDGEPLIKENFFAGNWTTGGGVGAIRVSKEGRARIIGNVIVRNQTGGAVRLVDGYSVMEGNLVTENLGGPGISYSQVFTHYQPSVIRDNVVYGNEKGEIVVDRDEGESPIIEDNQEVRPTDLDLAPGLELSIREASFDPGSGQTKLTFMRYSGAEDLVGRTVRLGTKWSVVVSTGSKSITVWGDFESLGQSLTQFPLIVLPDYASVR